MCLPIIPQPRLSFASHQRIVNAYFCQGKIDEPGYARLFSYHPLFKSHSIQKHDNVIHHPSLHKIIYTTCWTNNSLCSCVKTLQLGVRTSRIFVPGWVLGGDYGFAPDLAFCLVNIICNAWSSYLMLNTLRIVNIYNHKDQTRTKGLYMPCKLSRYSV